MQTQAYEGYVESGQFYPKEIPIRLSGRFRAVLTVLDVPVALSADEELPDWPFERSKEMRPPLDLTD